ncbi:hypothetical protein QQS21_003819 [Conoideocrella luteorostrata]|uniref:Heterokaryon incompatibility domain-containing protein n=1 Tax=Conoideocrella luteorostrata TaxID=1105319 RepID=A0AAJ0CSP5_9HYPO|nr:hypothetical protein QQS21_003819 [Conoideocrella luteorostrata]
MLCDSCRGKDFDELLDADSLQPSFAALKSSAESGYSRDIQKLCDGQNIWRSFSPSSDTKICATAAGFVDADSSSKRDIHFTRISLKVGDISPATADLHVSANKGTQAAHGISGRLPTQKPRDHAAMSNIKEWIHACDRRHVSCATLSVDQTLPKRILNIENKPIVWETEGAEGRYAALSYCWGTSGKNVLLMKDGATGGQRPTFEDFTTVGIEMDQLPKTVQDAILVCRALGLKYLWVDALCIVQREPNKDDFILESPKMSEYYSNAYVNIIAGSAKDCADGFLNGRPEPKVSPCTVSYRKNSKSMLVTLSLPSSQDNGPIDERAWPFQERVLSKRYLLYGPDQFQFRCKECILFEDGGFYQIPSLDADGWKRYLNSKASSRDPHSEPSVHNLLECVGSQGEAWQSYAYSIWCNAIHPYTQRKMSDPIDKLAAIAGCAKFFEKIMACKYMYGLWETHLYHGLLWTGRVILDGRTEVTRVEGRAPSWSWASIDGPVFSRQSNPDERKTLDILRHDGVSGSFDPFREPNAGPDAFRLVVRGHLRQAWCAPMFTSMGYIRVFLLDKRIFDFQDTAEFRERDIQNELKEEKIATGTWDSHDEYKNKRDWKSAVYALQVCEIPGNEAPEAGIAGLLLSQVDACTYKRIGCFKSGKKREFWNYMPQQEITLI